MTDEAFEQAARSYADTIFRVACHAVKDRQGGGGCDPKDAKYRLPIYLYYYEDCSIQEIADALRTNPSTVQARLQRAREKLRRSLCEETKEGNAYVRPKIVLPGMARRPIT